MIAVTGQAQSVASKTKIFISYSRKDMTFVDRLEPALKARGFEPLIDRSNIYAFENWWKRIEALIGRADTIVFVLSPEAVKSDVALKEVVYAASLNEAAFRSKRTLGEVFCAHGLRRLRTAALTVRGGSRFSRPA